jgi:hypothetical protein
LIKDVGGASLRQRLFKKQDNCSIFETPAKPALQKKPDYTFCIYAIISDYYFDIIQSVRLYGGTTAPEYPYPGADSYLAGDLCDAHKNGECDDRTTMV